MGIDAKRKKPKKQGEDSSQPALAQDLPSTSQQAASSHTPASTASGGNEIQRPNFPEPIASITNSFLDNGHKVYVLADSPHLFKNLRTGLYVMRVFCLSQEIVERYNLPTREVHWEVLWEVHRFQVKNNLKLAPTLTSAALTAPAIRRLCNCGEQRRWHVPRARAAAHSRSSRS